MSPTLLSTLSILTRIADSLHDLEIQCHHSALTHRDDLALDDLRARIRPTPFMKNVRLILVLGLTVVVQSAPALAQPVDVTKTNPMKVYMHYMPWFETPATLGGSNWGYHWKFNNRNPNIVDATGKRQIASHYYPRSGP